MITLQSLVLTAVVLAALGMVLGAGLYWRDNKAKVNAAIWRVVRFFLALAALPIVLIVYFFLAACVVLFGAFSFIFRILSGHTPHTVRVKVTFD